MSSMLCYTYTLFCLGYTKKKTYFLVHWGMGFNLIIPTIICEPPLTVVPFSVYMVPYIYLFYLLFLCFCACLPVFRHQGVHVGMLTNMSDRKALNVFKSVYLSLVNLSMMFHSFSGQALCTIAAVLGGKSLAAQISEKIVSRGLESTDLFILVTVVASNL